MDCIIRLAKLEEAMELSILKRNLWETTYRGIYPDSKIDNYDYLEHKMSFENIITNNEVNLYVVEDNKKIVGYMSCGVPLKPFKDFSQEIGLLYVKKEYQGTGLGKKLFNIGYNEIKKKGVNSFFIGCNKYNMSARKFYEKMGGNIIYVDDDKEDKYFVQVKFKYEII